ncbi:MAG: hypothetical protein LBD98_03285 [Endomicrobium sp.]|jgi:hypothetical protein|nr:hypothetical protein [Endomicrobium sp.]
MNRIKKSLAVVLSVVLITSSMLPREVAASWFSDLMGGMFTIISSPLLLIAPNNPTLRKNNPFRPKEWEEESVNEYKHPTRVPKKTIWEEMREELRKEFEEKLKKEREERLKLEAERAAEIERNRFADENIVYWTALATDPLAQEKIEAIRWDIENRERRERQRQAYKKEKKEKKERAELERNRFADENRVYCPALATDYLAQRKLEAKRLEEQAQADKDEEKEWIQLKIFESILNKSLKVMNAMISTMDAKIKLSIENQTHLKERIRRIEENVLVAPNKEEEKVSWGQATLGGLVASTYISKFVETFGKDLVSGWKTQGRIRHFFYLIATAGIGTGISLVNLIPSSTFIYTGLLTAYVGGTCFSNLIHRNKPMPRRGRKGK